MSILIKEVLLNNETTDIYIDGNQIKTIGKNLAVAADKVISGKNKAAIPGFINGHGHAAMTLFRGFGDDMPLESWLQEKIWPQEAKLTEEDVYWGSKLACLEMIKSGTTCFNDMYWFFEATVKAVEEMGIRAFLSQAVIDLFDEKKTKQIQIDIPKWHEIAQKWNNRIEFTLGLHSIYTVSAETFKWSHEYAKANNLLIHMHIAETQTEYDNSIKNFGLSPVQYLNKLGVLSPNLIVVHCLWVDETDIQLLADNGVKVIHNPASNLKLSSGYQFRYEEMKKAGLTIGLGTDGCASSNNLDMLEAAKLASLLQKAWRFDPTAMPAEEAFYCATEAGGEVFNKKTGKIQEGYLADLCLVDLKQPTLVPNFNLTSNLVYSANGSCVDTVICDGKMVMENKYVSGEEEIIENASKAASNLVART